jgi:hypothetical protein
VRSKEFILIELNVYYYLLAYDNVNLVGSYHFRGEISHLSSGYNLYLKDGALAPQETKGTYH